MDGVVTRTAAVHSRAWKQMFDDYLRKRAEWGHEPYRAFTHEGDYLTYVDGRPRYQGVEGFPEIPRHRAAAGHPGRRARSRDRLRAGQPQE